MPETAKDIVEVAKAIDFGGKIERSAKCATNEGSDRSSSMFNRLLWRN